MGATIGFGSTLEQYMYTTMTCGTRRRGRPQDGPFKTGKGYVEFKKGHYHDGI